MKKNPVRVTTCDFRQLVSQWLWSSYQIYHWSDNRTLHGTWDDPCIRQTYGSSKQTFDHHIRSSIGPTIEHSQKLYGTVDDPCINTSSRIDLSLHQSYIKFDLYYTYHTIRSCLRCTFLRAPMEPWLVCVNLGWTEPNWIGITLARLELKPNYQNSIESAPNHNLIPFTLTLY